MSNTNKHPKSPRPLFWPFRFEGESDFNSDDPIADAVLVYGDGDDGGEPDDVCGVREASPSGRQPFKRATGRT